jgi:hypothetical protein
MHFIFIRLLCLVSQCTCAQSWSMGILCSHTSKILLSFFSYLEMSIIWSSRSFSSKTIMYAHHNICKILSKTVSKEKKTSRAQWTNMHELNFIAKLEYCIRRTNLPPKLIFETIGSNEMIIQVGSYIPSHTWRSTKGGRRCGGSRRLSLERAAMSNRRPAGEVNGGGRARMRQNG